jgi:hypothetical protein
MQAEGQQAQELFQEHSNMQNIAHETGGKAFYNRNDIDTALENGIDDGATYYTLSYYPENKNWNGKFRKLHVESHRKDVKLRYRAGYFAVDRADFLKRHPHQRDIDLGQALSPDAPTTAALPFQATVLPPSAETRNKTFVLFAVDSHSVHFDRSDDGLEHAQVDCVVRVFSQTSGEKPVTTAANRVNAALKPEAFDNINKNFFPCKVELDLGEGHYYLRLAVRDNITGTLGTYNAQISIPFETAQETRSDANSNKK